MKRIVPQGQYIRIVSQSRPGIEHAVYTGDKHNAIHCTCERFRWGEREPGKRFACIHIKKVVYGKGMS
jgi:hypothetical protein